MTLAALADLAEVVGAVAVVGSLIFVGVQIHQHTRQMRRAEANKAFEQASQLRALVLANRDVAQLLVAGLGNEPLDAADEMRLNACFSEMAYVAIQVWDREQYGLTTIGSFGRAVTPVLNSYMSTPRAVAWWRRSRDQFPSEFAALMEREVPALAAITPVPSAKAPQPGESAVARPADAG